MNYHDLKRLVNQGEGAQIEFKRKCIYPHKIMREVVAFSNSEGGFLLIGVTDDGMIPGLKHPEEDLYELEHAIVRYCSPKVSYKLFRIPIFKYSEYEVLVFQIFPAKKRPVFLITNFTDKTGIAYIRFEDKSLQASKEMLRILKNDNASNQGIFKLGEEENAVLKFIELKRKVSVQQCADACAIPYRRSSDILVRMTLAGILRIIPQETGIDLFEQKIENDLYK